MKAFKVGALILLGLVVLLAVIMIVLLSAKNTENPVEKEIVVVSGMGRADVAKLLSAEGLIKSQFAFFLYTKMIQANILPGTYDVSTASSASVIADDLASARFKTAKITIIEGWRATDIEQYLVKEKKLEQFIGFTLSADAYEGYLFPDTYEIKIEATINEVIELMRDNFDRRVEDLAIDEDLVILASIVEREARSDSDRTAIAKVYLNRLEIGMNLEADATVQYAKGNWRVISIDDYQSVISKYNTYLNSGLPPGPISNPGLASLKAVLTPDEHEYFYYFHAKGQTFFSQTFSEHQAKVRQYF